MSLFNNDIAQQANEAMLESIESAQMPRVSSMKVARSHGLSAYELQYERELSRNRGYAIEPFTRRSGQDLMTVDRTDFLRLVTFLDEEIGRDAFTRWWREMRNTKRPLRLVLPNATFPHDC